MNFCMLCHSYHGTGIENVFNMGFALIPYFSILIIILQFVVAYLGYRLLKVVGDTPLWSPAWKVFVIQMFLLAIRRVFTFLEVESVGLVTLFRFVNVFIFPTALTLGWLLFAYQLRKLFEKYLKVKRTKANSQIKTKKG